MQVTISEFSVYSFYCFTYDTENLGTGYSYGSGEK